MRWFLSPRQSGKTWKLVDTFKLIQIYSLKTARIMIVAPNRDMIELIKGRIGEEDIFKETINNTYFVNSSCSHPAPLRSASQADFILIDEFCFCKDEPMEYLTKRHPEKIIMWSTPNGEPKKWLK
jgi:thymidine kinase